MSLRTASLAQPLSPSICSGSQSISCIKAGNAVTSCACPGVITTPIGRPSALVRALILVEKPPRDHLQRGVPDATVGPPPKLPKDRVPVAEALRQVAPRCAGSHQPKHRVEHAAMIAWRPAAAAMDQERFEVRPLIVGHQSANQGCPPQRAALNQFAILASIGLSTRPSPAALAGAISSRTSAVIIVHL